MNTNVKLLPALLLSLCAAGPIAAEELDAPEANDETPAAQEPTAQEILESQPFKSALSGVMRAMQQSEAGDGAQPATAAQGDAMSDAAGVAARALGLAAANPDATEAEKQAAAQQMMQGVFEGELAERTVELPQATRQPAQPANDYGDYDEKDYGDYDEQ